MLNSFSLLVFRLSCILATTRMTDFFKCCYEPMGFYIFNVFKSITVIIPLEVQIVPFLFSGSSFKFAPASFKQN